MQETVNRVSALIQKGHEPRFASLADHLEQIGKLPSELQSKLSTFGNTPIAEPKIYEAIQKADEEGPSVVALAALSEDEIIKYPATAMGDFIFALTTRISSPTDETGVYKKTPNTEACRQPNFIESDRLRVLMVKKEDKARELVQAPTEEAKEKALEAFKVAVNEVVDYAFTISGLTKDNLSDWEQALVVGQVVATASDAYLSAAGKR